MSETGIRRAGGAAGAGPLGAAADGGDERQALGWPDDVAAALPAALARGDVRELARLARVDVLHMVHRANASHVGSALSVVDALAVLYHRVLRVAPADPGAPGRDRFILSKGHACTALYAVLSQRGFVPRDWLASYSQDGAPLAGHADGHGVPGLEVSTGSLGHGLAVGAGMALAGQRDGRDYRVFVLLSDGECDEGSVWEAALFAGHFRLGNLAAVVDRNGLQGMGRTADVIDLEPFAAKWRAFGWGVREVDGHDLAALEEALSGVPFVVGQPSVVIARTVKGRGIGYMEGQLAWHYRSPNAAQLAAALADLDWPAGGAP